VLAFTVERPQLIAADEFFAHKTLEFLFAFFSNVVVLPQFVTFSLWSFVLRFECA
jgi:hypothetical protein